MAHVTARLGLLATSSCAAFFLTAAQSPGAPPQADELPLAGSEGCIPDWIPTFGAEPGTLGYVNALTAFDDGSGPALYAGGFFQSIAASSADGVARWDGQGWSALGSGLNSEARALAVFDDGSATGPALFAGGTFKAAGGKNVSRIAKWDGVEWSPLGEGLEGGLDGIFPYTIVQALTVFDDGSGPALIAAGFFTDAGGGAASNIARWDGQGWAPLGSGLSGEVHALAVFDDGSGAGPALYAGGEFTSAGGQPASYIARWDGQTWSALGSGVNSFVFALTVFDDGSGAGPALHAGGWFTEAGGQSALHVARWDGQGWSPLGSGINDAVLSLLAFDDGTGAGPVLHAGGPFLMPGGPSASPVAAWDGQQWKGVGAGAAAPPVHVQVLGAFDDGSGAGPALYVGGNFEQIGDAYALSIARLDGPAWSALTSGVDDAVVALTTYDDGSGAGPALVAGGWFSSAGGQAAARIATWDGESWSALGSGADAAVRALQVFDDGLGAGPSLFVGGGFLHAGGVAANSIARWDGQSWSALGAGVNAVVRALTVFDDGSGPALYVAGDFTAAGGLAASRIAGWNGHWSALGSGLDDEVHALAVYDDGSGPALYAGGRFNTAGAASASGIARWDGQGWSPLGSGIPDAEVILALAVYDDGSGAGPALYAGGDFTSAGGVSAHNVARWDGQVWSALGAGTDAPVNALQVVDDASGAGPALYAGGGGGLALGDLAKWDGASWSAVTTVLDGSVQALAVLGEGPGHASALVAGGTFTLSPGGDSFVALLGCAVGPVPGCAGNPAVLSAPTGAAALATPFDVSLAASQVTSGVAVLSFGLDGTDASGCGVAIPGLGELLLAAAPAPHALASTSLGGGVASFTIPVPATPALAGAEIALQAAALGVFDPGFPIELSNALLVTLTK